MGEPKRILILTNDVGFGHRSAANAVAAALQDLYGEQVQVEILNPLDDERAPASIRDSQVDYDKMVRDMPDYYKLRYEVSDMPVTNAIVEQALMVLLYNPMRDIIQRIHPDAIVVTNSMFSPPVNAVVSVNKLNIPFIVTITDLTDVHRLWLNDAAHLICAPTGNVLEQALESGISADRLQVTGIPVHPDFVKEKRDPHEIRRELGWKPELITVLAVGSKRVKNLPEVLDVINHCGWPIQLAVVAGGDDELYETLQKKEWHIPSYIYNFVENIPAMIHAADCLVSKAGGLIVTEALAAGRPLLLVDITPGQEMGNAGYVIDNGAALRAETQMEVLEAMAHWFKNDCALLKDFSRRAAALGRPMSAYMIAEKTFSAAERGIDQVEISTPVLPKLLEFLNSFGLAGPEDSISGGL